MSKAPHLGTKFYFHMHMIRNGTKSFSVSFQLQWIPKKTQDQPKKQ